MDQLFEKEGKCIESSFGKGKNAGQSEVTVSKKRQTKEGPQTENKSMGEKEQKTSTQALGNKQHASKERQALQDVEVETRFKQPDLVKKEVKVALDEFFGRKNKEIHRQKLSRGVLTNEVKRVSALLDGVPKSKSTSRSGLLVNTHNKSSLEDVKHIFKYDPDQKSTVSFKQRRKLKLEASVSEIIDFSEDSEVVTAGDIEILENVKESLSEEEWKTVVTVAKSMPKSRLTLNEIREIEKQKDPFHEEEEKSMWDESDFTVYDEADSSIAGTITKKVNCAASICPKS